jgi:hypothetical protein
MEDPEALAFGLEMAVQVAKVKRSEPWDLDGFGGEGKDVAEALLIGYQTYVWPRWLRDYDVVSIEQEYPLQLTPWLTYNSRPDTVMRKKSDGTLWYGPEDKTTGWVDSLIHYAQNVQLHATALCIEEHLPGNEKIQGCLVQGLYKGYVKERQLYHPLVYAYCKEGRHGIVPDQWSPKWVKGGSGWLRSAVRNYPGGVRGWIAKLGEGELGGVFPVSPPVMINRSLAQAYFRQVEAREKEIEGWRMVGAEAGTSLLDEVFPQSFSQCNEWSKSRKPCDYMALCYNPTVQKYPLGTYKYRTPHHPNELSERRQNTHNEERGE